MSFSDDIKWSAPTHFIRGLRTVGPVTITGDWVDAVLTTGDQSGTAGAGTTSTSMVKPGGAADWTADEMRTGNMFLRITAGGGAPAVRPIIDNATTTITVHAVTGMNATSVFEISTVSTDYTFTNLTLGNNLPEIIIDHCVIKKLSSSHNTKITLKNCILETDSPSGSISSYYDKVLYINECSFNGASIRCDNANLVYVNNSIFTNAESWAYLSRCNYVSFINVNAESCSSTALHLEGILVGYVGMEANSCTATPCHMESCNYITSYGIGLIGTNAGAPYGVLMEKAGYYDLTAGTLAGAADLRIEDQTCTWAQLGTYKCITRKGVAIMTTA